LSAVKPTVVCTVAAAAPPDTSMMLMVPLALLLVDIASASFATRILLPSGVNVTMSGSTPTWIVFCRVPAALNSAT
jgi:hypothetical protein